MLEELRENKELWKTFCGWKETCQQEYLDLCTGVKGIKLLYDTDSLKSLSCYKLAA